MTEWWKTGTIYQIYPRSFQDTDGDGVGDLRGITKRLAYVASLGVDAIWLSPVFISPMADFGYDIADYTAIDPLFGTLDDFDALAAEVRRLGLKLILDLVPNHTSDAHPWFRDSRLARESRKRDWYIWRDGRDGGPPNNWISNFGGSAWEFDPATGQYYYHAFLKEQPDLNWRNPDVRAAMHDVLRFWMARGADGFRVDVIWHLMKDPEFRDNPPNPDWRPGYQDIGRFHQVHSADHADVHDVVAELRRVVDEYPDRVLIGEIYLPLERLVTYYGEQLSGAHLPFNFQLLQTPWRADALAQTIHAYEAALPEGGWPNWVLGNHDRPRIAARVGEKQARVAALLLLTLRGTPTLYYGDEIGISDVAIPPEAVQDPWEKQEPGLGLGRDPVRTPMQWDRSPNAGFSSASPWLPPTEDWPARNVEELLKDPGSILDLYRKLLAMRRGSRALQEGSYRPMPAAEGVLAYLRTYADERIAVILNLTSEPRSVHLPDCMTGSVLVATGTRAPGCHVAGLFVLVPDEGLVIALNG